MSAQRSVVAAREPDRIRADVAPAVEGDRCPRCGASLQGEPIAADKQHLYGKATHFRREVNVQPDTGSGVMFYVCPDCHGAWGPSFTNATGSWAERGPALVEAAIEAHHADVAHLADHDRVAAVLAEHREMIVFALGLAGCRWLGWTVDAQIGSRLHLITEPVLGSQRPTPETARLISNATGWPEHLIVILSSTSPMVRCAHDGSLRSFTPAPPALSTAEDTSIDASDAAGGEPPTA